MRLGLWVWVMVSFGFALVFTLWLLVFWVAWLFVSMVLGCVLRGWVQVVG